MFSLRELAVPVVGAVADPLAGDPHGTNLWAGRAWRSIGDGPAADIVAALGRTN